MFMISSISLFEIIDAAMSDPSTFPWIVVSVADATAVNSNGIKSLLANGLCTFFIKYKSVLSYVPRSLCNCVFDRFILADELFAKIYQASKFVY